MRRRTLPVLILAVALLTSGACGGREEGSGAGGPAPQAPPAAQPGQERAADPTPGRAPAPLLFQAAGLDGSRVNGADYAGKDVALWFWAPW